MMNNDGTAGGNNVGLVQMDDQQMITLPDRENYVARMTHHLGGNRELAKHYDDDAFKKSGGKAVLYKKVLQMIFQQRNQQIQQQQQQQQQQIQQQQQMQQHQQQQQMQQQQQQMQQQQQIQQQQQQQMQQQQMQQQQLQLQQQQQIQQQQQQQQMQQQQQIQQQQQQQQMQQQQQQQQQHQMQQQQQMQQQSIINAQQQSQTMYMTSQQPQMVGMPHHQQQPQSVPPSYAMQTPSSMSIMNVKQEPQPPMSNMQIRPNPQNFPMQQQQLKQELMAPPMSQQQQQQMQLQQPKPEIMVQSIPLQQQQIKQELMAPPTPQQQQQQQQSMPMQQMRSQQSSEYNQQQFQYTQPPTPAPPTQSNAMVPPQRTIVQHLQQVRQQNHLNQQQLEPSNANPSQQQASSSSTLQQSSSMNGGGPSSSTAVTSTTSSSGSSDEILQQLLTSPNPPKQPSNIVQNGSQARLRTINRNVRQALPPSQVPQIPMTPGSDPMMVGNVPSPHSHPGMMQQPQTPIGPPGQSPLARYMMAQSPQANMYRPQMSPMPMMNYPGSPTAMIDEEMHFLFKFFTERIHYLTRIINRCQQEGQHDKVAKYRQLHDQMAAFVRNPMPEHLMVARRLKDHVDRILDPRMFGPVMMPPMVDMTGMMPSNSPNNGRLVTNGIFEQCQRAIFDYLGKDTTLKYNVSKRFLEPLSDVLNGVPHRNMRLDTESKQSMESYSSSSNISPSKYLANTIESEFALLSMNTFTYELKPLSDKLSSADDIKNSQICDYELTCRFVEINMPVVPPLKMKITIQYPHEPPEVLSLPSTALNFTPSKHENSEDGHSFFESISRNFIYFLFKLPTQYTVTDVLDIWHTAIRSASSSQQES